MFVSVKDRKVALDFSASATIWVLIESSMGMDASVLFIVFSFCLQNLARCIFMPCCVAKFFPHPNSQLICIKLLDVFAEVV